MPMRPQCRRNNCDAMSTFDHGEQRVRCPAFEHDVWFDLGETAGSIKCPTEDVARIQYKEWLSGYSFNADRVALAKRFPRLPGR